MAEKTFVVKSFCLAPDEAATLERIAEKEDVKFSWLIRKLVRAGWEKEYSKKEKKEEPT